MRAEVILALAGSLCILLGAYALILVIIGDPDMRLTQAGSALFIVGLAAVVLAAVLQTYRSKP